MFPAPYEAVLIVYEEGKERKRMVHYNAVQVKLSSYGHKLYLVVVKGFGMGAMMLLTSCAVRPYQKESVCGIIWLVGNVMSRIVISISVTILGISGFEVISVFGGLWFLC